LTIRPGTIAPSSPGYNPLDGTDHADLRGRDSMIGRSVIWCPQQRLRQRLRRILDRVVA